MPIMLGEGIVDDDFWEEWDSERKRQGVVKLDEAEPEKKTRRSKSTHAPTSDAVHEGSGRSQSQSAQEQELPDRRRTRSITAASESKNSEDDEPCPLPTRKRSKRSDQMDKALLEKGRKFATPRERLAWYRESESFTLELSNNEASDCAEPYYFVTPRNNTIKGRHSFATRFGRDLRMLRFLPPENEDNPTKTWIRWLRNPLSGEPEPIDTFTLRTEAETLAEKTTKRANDSNPFARVAVSAI